jgi:arginine decarboxylase
MSNNPIDSIAPHPPRSGVDAAARLAGYTRAERAPGGWRPPLCGHAEELSDHREEAGAWPLPPWEVEHARAVYNITQWGGGYFDVSPHGTLIVRPDRDPNQAGIDLCALAGELRHAGLTLPVLVRFTDILQHRVQTLCAAFEQAMQAEDYPGTYTAVYPIKVNQQRSVVEPILRGGRPGQVGLEAGSKPELMAVLALAEHHGGMVICNGYKDREYIRLALIGRQLGHRLYLVVEKFSELELIIEEARRLGVAPLLGVRVRLSCLGTGKWQDTSGDKSKFGLPAAQVLRLVERLRAARMLEALQLLHFHLGSQIANIRDIQRGLHECARHYAELHRLGACLTTVDVGGGLGVDYEGTQSRSACSMNYSVQEYANNIVYILRETCAQQGLPYPHIVTESGRAMTAHHAVLLANVIDIEQVPEGEAIAPPAEDAPLILHNLWHGLQQVVRRSSLEAYHDTVHWLAEAQEMYTHGVLSLEQRARAEQLYYATCHRVRPLLSPRVQAHREVLDELNEKLADKYFLNFSLFQSTPDAWSLNQIFPVVPLHRLDQAPQRRGVIQDLTCDSEGRIDYYVDREGVKSTLPLHGWQRGEEYLVGIFLLGAYQEIMGDTHNLFGDTDAVNVVLRPEGGHELTQIECGDTVASVLRYVHFNTEELRAAYQRKIATAPLTAAQREVFLQALEEGLRGYTYLED